MPRLFPALTVGAAALLLAGLTTDATSQPAEARQARTAHDVRRVLLISVDALNPAAIKVLGPDRLPAFRRLRAQGASTQNARTLVEETDTLPNHTSMMTGRRAALPEGTGVRTNEDPDTTLRALAGHYVAGVYDVVHDNGGSTAMYVAKNKFRLLDRSWNAQNGAPDLTGVDNGQDKVDRFVVHSDNEALLVRELDQQLLRAPATFTWLHLAAADRAGHRYGGMTPEYLSAVKRTDGQIRRVLRTIRSKRALRRHLLVIVTADHSTAGRGHSNPTKYVNYRIPFFAWGPGVARGANLYRLNPDLLRPGKGRPGYSGRQPIRNADVANLVTDLLGLPPVPGSEFDLPRTLDLR